MQSFGSRFRGLLCLLILTIVSMGAEADADITIGQTFVLTSKILDEPRRINVFTPTRYGQPVKTPLPVIYMPDGGMNEDFLHIAGLLQVLVSNGTMRPFRLVGIENTERHRDMTGPTSDPKDQAIAPKIGGSAAFRAFIREELFPEISRRYDTAEERAIIGESLAGLFVVETLALAPDMFDTYIAADPSVWWNHYALAESAPALLKENDARNRKLFVAAGGEASGSPRFDAFVAGLREQQQRVQVTYVPMPDETHATLYHPAALRALRTLFPATKKD